jgi:hypothetical protein
VVLTIDPPVEARTLGFAVDRRELTVSVEEPDRLVGELASVAR